MRRRHDMGMSEQRVGLRRLLDEHVERRARHMAGVERRTQRDLVNQPAARAIDDPHAFLALARFSALSTLRV